MSFHFQSDIHMVLSTCHAFDILTTVRLKFSNNVLKQELFITNANVSHYTNYPTSTKGFATFILTFKLSIRSKQKILRERLCCIASSSSFFFPFMSQKNRHYRLLYNCARTVAGQNIQYRGLGYFYTIRANCRLFDFSSKRKRPI